MPDHHLVAELEIGLAFGLELRPLRETGRIGVAGLGELNPVLDHGARQLVVALIEGVPFEDVEDTLGRVVGAPRRLSGSSGVWSQATQAPRLATCSDDYEPPRDLAIIAGRVGLAA